MHALAADLLCPSVKAWQVVDVMRAEVAKLSITLPGLILQSCSADVIRACTVRSQV